MGEARQVMDRITEAALAGDQEAVKALYAPDAVLEAPDAGTITGNEGIAAYLGEFVSALSDADFELVHGHEAGDVAIDEGYMIGRHTGPVELPDGQTVEPTGREIRVRECDVATVRDGVVVSHRMYFDMLDWLGQLGLTEAGTETARAG
jgi:ketosteroid isomerase-like protein